MISMGDNILAIIAVSLIAAVAALLVGILTSDRVRRQGLFRAFGREVSASDRLRNPYKG